MVRGPGLPQCDVQDDLVNAVDLRPTFEYIASADTPDLVDGQSLLPLGNLDSRRYTYSESPAKATAKPAWHGIYSANTAYHLWGTGEEEFYDLAAGPCELDSNPADSRIDEHKQALAEYQKCAGVSCRTAGQ